jgi:hypothetical protein
VAGPLVVSSVRGLSARLATLPVSVPPAAALAVLLILLGTQLAYLVAPRAPHFLIRLALSGLAVLMGEALGLVGLGASLVVGDLHPVNDLALLVLLQWGASRWMAREQPA